MLLVGVGGRAHVRGRVRGPKSSDIRQCVRSGASSTCMRIFVCACCVPYKQASKQVSACMFVPITYRYIRLCMLCVCMIECMCACS